MTCKKCGSQDVITFIVEHQKKRGCLAVCLWVLLAVCTCGVILLVPLLSKKGSKTITYAVCQNCGKRWKVRGNVF